MGSKPTDVNRYLLMPLALSPKVYHSMALKTEVKKAGFQLGLCYYHVSLEMAKLRHFDH